MAQYITHSENETKALAAKFAKMVRQAHHKVKVIALTGELGAGKTTFVQGFAKGLGIKDKIISPTFVLIRQHKMENNQVLYHIDLYRLEGKIDIKQLGIEELLNSDNLILIEWAEKIKNSLPKSATWILLEKQGDSRKITIK